MRQREKVFTDNQRLEAMMLANGLTIEDFSAMIGRTPQTIKKRLSDPFYANWELDRIEALDAAMQGVDPTYRSEDLEAIFFSRYSPKKPLAFKKPFILAIIELVKKTTEEAIAEQCGLTLEELRGLYNACDTQEKRAKAVKVWRALFPNGGHYEGFYHSFMAYPYPKA